MARGRGGFIGQDGLNAPDSPTGVSATAGNTTVSVAFTAPTDVGGSAITGYNVQSNNGDGSIPRFSNSSYDSKSFSVASQESNLLAFYINNSGTKLFVVGYANDTVYQYTLSTAWDISSASYDSKSFSVASQMTIPRSLEFKPDGTKMYVGEYPTIYQYSLSSAFDVSTASYDSVSFSPSSQTSTLHEVVLSPDGTKMYITALDESSLFQYTLSTPYNLSTASYASKSLSTSSQDSTPYGLAFSSDGTKVYVSGGNTSTVYEYNLTTAYDISTGSYSGISFDASAQGANNQYDIVFKTDDSKMYLAGLSSDTVFQYSLPDYPTASPVTVTGLTNGTSYTFNVWAINAFGYSAPSDASTGVTPALADRAIFAGGLDTNTSAFVNTLQYVTVTSTGNTQDFGDLTESTNNTMGLSSSTRGVRGGGGISSGRSNVMDYVTIASTGNAQDFGDLSSPSFTGAGTSNETRGLFAIGRAELTYVNTTEYITIASTGNTTDFGDRTVAAAFSEGAVASTTRAVFALGYIGAPVYDYQNVIDYFTIASTGNATDFGDATVARYGCGAGNSSTRGIWSGGVNASSALDITEYITIASTGNATDFGDLSTGRHQTSGASNLTRCLIGGGRLANNNATDIISYFTISSTGNDTDFGDLAVGVFGLTAFSNSHGGLS